MSNIISLKYVANYFWITMDTSKEHSIIMHTGYDSIIKFWEWGDGVYYLDTSVHENPTNNIIKIWEAKIIMSGEPHKGEKIW